MTVEPLRARLSVANLVLVVVMAAGFRLGFETFAYIASVLLFAGCLAVVYIDLKELGGRG